MAQIIRMEEFHRPRPSQLPARRASDRAQQARLFCTRCRCESFSLLLAGTVLCVNCGAVIKNVRLAIQEPAAAPDA